MFKVVYYETVHASGNGPTATVEVPATTPEEAVEAAKKALGIIDITPHAQTEFAAWPLSEGRQHQRRG